MSSPPADKHIKSKTPDRGKEKSRAKINNKNTNNCAKEIKTNKISPPPSECDRKANTHCKDVMAYCNTEKAFVCSSCLVTDCKKNHEIISLDKAVELALKNFEQNRHVVDPYEDHLCNMSVLLMAASKELKKIGTETLREVLDFFEILRKRMLEYESQILEFWNAFIEKECNQLDEESSFLRDSLEEVHELTTEIPHLSKDESSQVVEKVAKRARVIDELMKLLSKRPQISSPPVFSKEKAFSSILKRLKTDVLFGSGVMNPRNEYNRAMRRDYKQLKEENIEEEKSQEGDEGSRFLNKVKSDINFMVEVFEGTAKCTHLYEILGKTYESINLYANHLLKSDKKGQFQISADSPFDSSVSGMKRWKSEKEVLDFLRKKYPNDLKKQYFKEDAFKAKSSTDTIPTQFPKKIIKKIDSISPNDKLKRDLSANQLQGRPPDSKLKGESTLEKPKNLAAKDKSDERVSKQNVAPSKSLKKSLTPTKDDHTPRTAAFNLEKTVKRPEKENKMFSALLEVEKPLKSIQTTHFISASSPGPTMTGLSPEKEVEILLNAASKHIEKNSKLSAAEFNSTKYEKIEEQKGERENSNNGKDNNDNIRKNDNENGKANSTDNKHSHNEANNNSNSRNNFITSEEENSNTVPERDESKETHETSQKGSHGKQRKTKKDADQSQSRKIAKRNSFSEYMKNNNFTNLLAENTKKSGTPALAINSIAVDEIKGRSTIENGEDQGAIIVFRPPETGENRKEYITKKTEIFTKDGDTYINSISVERTTTYVIKKENDIIYDNEEDDVN